MPLSKSFASVPLPLWLLVAVSLSLMIWTLTKERPAPTDSGSSHPRVGSTFADVDLTAILNADRDLELADLQGHVSVLNFWGTWCPPCRMELPRLSHELEQFNANVDFQFLPISCSGKAPPEDLADLRTESADFLAVNNLTFPVYADANGQTLAAADLAVGFGGFPTTVVFDRQGTVRGVWTGYLPGDEKHVAKLVKELLEAKPPAASQHAAAN